MEGDPHQCAYKLKVDVGLESAPIEPIQLHVLVELKHGEGGVKQLLHYQLKIFFPDPTHVDSWFTLKLNFEWKSEWIYFINFLHLDNLLQRL